MSTIDNSRIIYSTADAHIVAIASQNQSQTQSQSREKENQAQLNQSSQNDDQNSSAGSVATTPEREIAPKGTKGINYIYTAIRINSNIEHCIYLL